MTANDINIRLVGDNIHPHLKKAGDIAEIIKTIESLIIARASNLFEGSKDDDFILSLSSIKDGSIALGFSTPSAHAIYPAFLDIIKNIENNSLNTLDNNTLKHLGDFVSLAKKHQFSTVFSSNKHATTLSNKTEVPESSYCTTPGKIFGRINRVGGKVPKVTIQLNNKESLTCRISAENAQKLGQHLYENVEFLGRKTWSPLTYKVTGFDVDSFKIRPKVVVKDVLNEISDLVGESYKSDESAEIIADRLRYGDTA